MTKEWFREIPYNPNVDDPADVIVEMLSQPRKGAYLDAVEEGISLVADKEGVDLDPDKVRRLIRDVRHVHRMVLSEWNRRNEPGWKPPRRLKDIQALSDDGPVYDYGEMEGEGLPPWDAWWKECWGASAGNPGRFRDGPDVTKPGHVEDVAKAPLVAIYHLCNRFWRRELGTAFWCDFRAWDFGNESHGRARLEYINASALFFVMIAWSVDESAYTVERCQKVHNMYYKKLDRTIPD